MRNRIKILVEHFQTYHTLLKVHELIKAKSRFPIAMKIGCFHYTRQE